MKKLYIAIVLIFIVPAVSFGGDVYKIGVLGNTNSSIAVAAYNTAQMLADAGGNTADSFELKAVFFDETEEGIKDRIKNEGGLVAVIGCFSAAHKEVVNEADKITFISLCSRCPEFIENKNTFRIAASEGQLARIQARIDYSVFGHRTFGVVYSGGKEKYKYMAEAYADTLKNNRGTLIQFKEVAPERKDFSNIIMYLRDKKTKVIYFAGPYKQAARFAKQSRKMNSGAVFTSTAEIYNSGFSRRAGRGAQGSEFVTKLPPSIWRIKGFKDFLRKYNKKYRTTSLYMPYAYDAVSLVIDAVKNGAQSGKETAGFLKQADYKGVSGRVAFGETGENTDPEFYFYVIRGSEFLYRKFRSREKRLYKQSVF